MISEDLIRRMEEQVAGLEPLTALAVSILAGLTKSPGVAPGQLEETRGLVRSICDLLKHGDFKSAEPLVEKAEKNLAAVQQWLVVADLGISPFVLRNTLERDPLPPDALLRLLHYFFAKHPHAENDRDKVDYLITAYFSGAAAGERLWERPAELRRKLEELFGERARRDVGTQEEVTVHELESLIARIEDFTDFDQLVQARMVERVRALKTNLGDTFYHAHVLASVIRFNVLFRHHFEKLFHQQLAAVRKETRDRIAEAWNLVRAIEDVYERLAVPETERSGTVIIAAIPREPEAERVGRPLVVLDERPPLDRLIRRGDASPKESELRGILARMAHFVERLPAEQATSDKVFFPLRNAKMELSGWERRSFATPPSGQLTESARTIQYALGVVAWVDEELSQHEQTRSDRYLWKTHFDSLSYAVVRTVELLKAVREIMREGTAEPEAEWFGPLLHTAQRLTRTLNRLSPVFEEPAA